MGFFKNTIEDFKSLANASRRSQIVLSLLGAALLYIVVDARHFGDPLAEWLTEHGFSLFNRVQLSIAVDERTPTIEVGRNGGDVSLEVRASGEYTPCRGGEVLTVSLVRYRERNKQENEGELPLKHEPEDRETVKVDRQCRWRLARPFSIEEPDEYEVEAVSDRFGQGSARASAQLTRVSPLAIDSSGLLAAHIDPDKLAKHARVAAKDLIAGKRNRATVSVVYLDAPNFSRYVFESALTAANPILRSIELQIVGDEAPTGGDNSMWLDEAAFAALEATANLKEFAPSLREGFVVGITHRPLWDAEHTHLYLTRRKRFMVIATDYPVFTTGSVPSVYKYLLTNIIAFGAIKAAHSDVESDHHTETRGCLLDYTEEVSRDRLVIANAYLCDDDRQRLQKRLTPSEFTDLTATLPLDWLK